MERYIEANALIKQMKNSKYVDGETPFQLCVNTTIDYWINEVKYFPSTNVVPKNEVKCIYAYDGEVEEYCVQSPCPNYKTIEQTKYELAREIFEEIEKLIYSKCLSVRADRDVTGLILDGELFAELKKKYTESEEIK